MKKVLFIYFIFFLSKSYEINAQGTIEDRALKVVASVSENPRRITLTWDNSTFATSTQIYKKLKTEPLFSNTPIANIIAPNASYVDNDVAIGIQYDYTLLQTTTFTSSNTFTLYAWGGISAGIKVSMPFFKGKLLVVADTAIQNQLSAKFIRFTDDLIEEGWTVSVVNKTAQDSVPSIKAKIKSWYNSNKDYAKSLILLGNIPVPYSGNFGIEATPPDGHSPDHNGAWAADVYYGVINDENLFTDVATNENGINREANKNRPGDGKFDQSIIPGKVDLEVGRIDMSNLNAVGSNYLGRTEMYFDKNHAFRNKHFEVPPRYIFEDRLNLLGSEAPGRLHYFQTSLFGKDSLRKVSNNFFEVVKSTPCLWSGVTTSAGYTSLNGIGNVNNFADTVYSVFSNYFGSYFLDWDNNNNFLRGAIGGPGYTLTSIWSGRPVVHFHQMALGENIGFSLVHAQSNALQTGFMSFYPGISARSIHMSMHGDPTLRLHAIHPISNLQAQKIDNDKKVSLTWTASTESGIDGYFILRAVTPEGPYQLANTSAVISETAYIDHDPWLGTNYYMIRAGKIIETPSGSYYNLSQGRRVRVDGVDGNPEVNVPNISQKIKINFYPNPSSGILNIEYTGSLEKPHFSILNINGQEIYNGILSENNTQFDFSHLTPSVYLIKVKSEKENFHFKWVKQ